jgi:hypothetical protein
MSCTIPSTFGRVKDESELKHSTHDETHFGLREPFPLDLGPGAQARGGAIGAPLAIAGREGLLPSLPSPPPVDIMEFRVPDFVAHMAHRAAESRTVTVNLAQGVVASRF